MSERSQASMERVKRIIQGLQAKTEANGATEEEAMAAAAKLGELLEQYDLSIDEVGVREDASQCRKNEVFAADDAAGSLISGIGKFCTLIVYQTRGTGHGSRYTFFGTPHDLEIAVYLYEITAEAMDHDFSSYMEREGYSMKKRMSFRAGFSQRVYQRLMKMKADRDARRPTGTALVVLKDQLVKSEWAKEGIHLSKSRGTFAADRGAFAQGQAAGGRVNLNNPLGGPSGPRGHIR